MEAGTEEKKEQEQQDEQNGSGDGNLGTIEEVQGVVLEVAFGDNLPEIYNALEVEMEVEGEKHTLICEVQQHLGDERVRAVAMDSTDGLARGMEVRDTGGPITVPPGDATPGRIFNLLGEAIDEGGGVGGGERWPPPPDAPGGGGPPPTRENFES